MLSAFREGGSGSASSGSVTARDWRDHADLPNPRSSTAATANTATARRRGTGETTLTGRQAAGCTGKCCSLQSH
eukprot:4737665-Prymnesium_polylepis.1